MASRLSLAVYRNSMGPDHSSQLGSWCITHNTLPVTSSISQWKMICSGIGTVQTLLELSIDHSAFRGEMQNHKSEWRLPGQTIELVASLEVPSNGLENSQHWAVNALKKTWGQWTCPSWHCWDLEERIGKTRKRLEITGKTLETRKQS